MIGLSLGMAAAPLSPRDAQHGPEALSRPWHWRDPVTGTLPWRLERPLAEGREWDAWLVNWLTVLRPATPIPGPIPAHAPIYSHGFVNNVTAFPGGSWFLDSKISKEFLSGQRRTKEYLIPSAQVEWGDGALQPPYPWSFLHIFSAFRSCFL